MYKNSKIIISESHSTMLHVVETVLELETMGLFGGTAGILSYAFVFSEVRSSAKCKSAGDPRDSHGDHTFL
jgi:hypothetical protein